MTLATSQKVSFLSGFGSVTDVPRLPDGFADTFQSYSVDTGNVRLHAVIGGSGEPLLLHIGWPQCWFAWRYLMLPLSKHYTVIAVDPRGLGISAKPADGYDVDTLANDMFGLMDALGYDRFLMAGHDIGLIVGYVMAASRPERIRRIALGEGLIVGASPSPPLIPEHRQMNDFLWHFGFNRALDINERLVEGREDLFFNYQFATKAASEEAVPKYARDFYIELMRRVPGTLKASFDHYRALDETIPQLRRHMAAKVTVPVFTFAGALACGDMVEAEFRTLADNVEALVISECGHFPPEEQPEALLAALTGFFAA
ncbi:alpha/beta fold hydrolase [Marinicaulis aureus]|uniref:Alpha/beta hydrolase n=2 Tax=Hyphococcus TaxID=2038635 RepID=A0A2S7K2A9_9PROT|nr:alpha/beta hydrolase [Marinicaulis flavus]MCK5750101.1 alpha/beta hydrolase [Oricola sp.]PQA86611.1 alpha/beta hydrolase [Marinicaulis flavus]